MDEAHPLGELFGIQSKYDEQCIALLERVKLNYGENRKCVKKRKVVAEREVDGIVRGYILTNGG